jgi:hypothetical protein
MRRRRVIRRTFYRRRVFYPSAARFHGLGYFAGRRHRWGSGTPYGNRAFLRATHRGMEWIWYA